MVLSDKDIRKRIKAGDIEIEPFSNELLSIADYTFTLNNKLFFQRAGDQVDVLRSKIELDNKTIGKEGYVVKPGDFLLAQTKEKLTLSNKVCCLLDARTSLARIGINFLQGSCFVDPGVEGSRMTLEIKNIGKSQVRIYPGMKVVKGIFMDLKTSSSEKYSKIGKYKSSSSVKIELD